MRVFLAGATGVIGRALVPQLREAGHEVVAMSRSAAGPGSVAVDALDAGAVMQAVQGARPDVVVNQLTSIPHRLDPRKIGKQFASTNRLREEGTRNLVRAAEAAGARRFISQSIAFAYAPGDGLRTEDDPLFDRGPAAWPEIVAAIRTLEQTTLGSPKLEGVVLRYGYFYGPGTAYAGDGGIGAMVRKRRFPIVGDGAAVYSFIHTEDAAAATVAALDRGRPGIYNVVDDDPAPVSEWLPEFAGVLGAHPPRRVPAFIARVAAGRLAVYMSTGLPGATNAKAKRELGWAPSRASWRQGFRKAIG